MRATTPPPAAAATATVNSAPSELHSKPAAVDSSSSSTPTDANDSNTTEEEEPKQPEETIGRLERFLGAGGLIILKRWLHEASTPEVVPDERRNSLEQNNTQIRTTLKQSRTRPLILPILNILQFIPFDRNLIKASKITKEIKDLKRKVNAIQENPTSAQDLKNWVEPEGYANPVKGVKVLDPIVKALDGVVSTWKKLDKEQQEVAAAATPPGGGDATTLVGENVMEESTKPTPPKVLNISNPLDKVRASLKARLNILVDVEAGRIDRPDWLPCPEELKQKQAAKMQQSQSKSARLKFLAMQERHLENARRDRNLIDAQEDSRRKLARLRELMLQQKEGKLPTVRRARKANGRTVRWKDNFTTKKTRNRELLEEVFIFDKTEEERAFQRSSRSGDDTRDERSVQQLEQQEGGSEAVAMRMEEVINIDEDNED